MSDAAAAIFNGLSKVFPEKSKNIFLKDFKYFSTSHSQNHLDASSALFLTKYRINQNVSIMNDLQYFEKS